MAQGERGEILKGLNPFSKFVYGLKAPPTFDEIQPLHSISFLTPFPFPDFPISIM